MSPSPHTAINLTTKEEEEEEEEEEESEVASGLATKQDLITK